jgi:phosphatidate cytidylyltransferase
MIKKRIISGIILVFIWILWNGPIFVCKLIDNISDIFTVISMMWFMLISGIIMFLCFREINNSFSQKITGWQSVIWYGLPLVIFYFPLFFNSEINAWNPIINNKFLNSYQLLSYRSYFRNAWLLILGIYVIFTWFVIKKKWTIVNNIDIFIVIFFAILLIFAFKGYYHTMINSSIYKCLISILFCCFLFDSSSFLVGIKFGKRKITPIISPNKTLEGTWGGFLTVFILGIIAFLIVNFIYNQSDKLSWLFPQYFHSFFYNPFFSYMFYLLFICTCFLIGDMLFSFWKRYFLIKDFDKLIPGHGGILDRIDSLILLFAIFFCYEFIFNFFWFV